jgi:hypothetical protein
MGAPFLIARTTAGMQATSSTVRCRVFRAASPPPPSPPPSSCTIGLLLLPLHDNQVQRYWARRGGMFHASHIVAGVAGAIAAVFGTASA